MPRAPFVDQLRPTEQLQRVFISVPKRHGEHFPITPGTIGQVIKAILKKLGFDVTKFRGHILRSAALRATIDATQDHVTALSVASVFEKVFHIFYDLSLHAASATPVIPGDLATAQAATALVMTACLPQLAWASVPNNHNEASGAFTRRSSRNSGDE